MKYYAREKLGPKQSVRLDGSLLCQDVPIARTGVLEYADGEIIITTADEEPIELGPDGIIRAERLPEDLFRPETIASFEGMTVTDDHPPGVMVSIENWKTYAVGHIQNVRRGAGIEDSLLLGDIIIKDPDAIQAVREGKREVSPGYDFKCERLGPGRVRQFNFIGNHVALVDAGRCGSRCSIGDHAMTTQAKPKMSLKDRIINALRTGDNATAEKLVTEEVKDTAAETLPGAAAGTTINLHMAGGPQSAPAAKDEGAGGGEKKTEEADPLKQIADSVSGLCTRMDDFGTRLIKLEGGGAKAADADADANKDKDKDKDKDAKTGDAAAKDSVALEPTFQDTIARAEILAPGVKLIAFDAKAAAKSTGDALCVFRRRVLDTAYQTEDGKAAIEPMLAGGKLDTKAMTCDGASMLFIAASENMKRANNDRGVGSGRIAMDHSTVKVMTPAEINKRNRERRAKPR